MRAKAVLFLVVLVMLASFSLAAQQEKTGMGDRVEVSVDRGLLNQVKAIGIQASDLLNPFDYEAPEGVEYVG